MYDRIVAPLREGTTVQAVERPRKLAQALGCELTLLHVHRPRQAPADQEGLTQYRFQHVVETWDARDSEAEAREVEWLGDLADAVAALDPDVDVSSRVVHAPLSRCVGSEDEQLLVVADADGGGDAGLDETIQELIRTCGVPVILLRRGMGLLPIRRILVPMDGSRHSVEALAPAIELARATSAALTLLEVVSQHGALVRFLHPADRSAEAAERSLREISQRVPPELGPVEVRVVEQGNAAAGILMETRRGDVDMVAMATHGRGGLRRLLLGSVAESVVRDSPVPVLVYRPQAVGADTAEERPVSSPA
jgi:nucleotide-binding universal stress UspA family protein